MQNREFDTRSKTKPSLSRQVVEPQRNEHEAGDARLPQSDMFAQLISGNGDASSASVHASMLNRATKGRPSHAGQSLLRLQRQYGNRYMQRVLAIARKGAGEAEAAPEVEQNIQQARGSGQFLDSKVQGQMESGFGADFSKVRVHTDTRADMLNRELNARAFTTGQDIFFRQSEYNPASSGGRELIAHELTHVVQQTSDEVQRKLTIGQPDDKYEQEADQVGRTMIQMEQQVAQKHPDEGLVRRQVEEEEKEEGIQTKPLAEPINPLAQRQVEKREALQANKSKENDIFAITSEHGFSIRKATDQNSEYDEDDYRGAIVDNLHRLVMRHHRAVSNFKNTLLTETFDAGTATSIIVGKGIGLGLGFVPGAGPVLSTLWDIGRDIYQQSGRAAVSSSVNQFCQICLDDLDVFEENQESRISELVRRYIDELSEKQGTVRQSYMVNARQRNIEGYNRVPEAGTIEGDLYEAYLTARTRGGVIEELVGFETKGRIELEYDGTFASTPYSLHSASVKDSGNDSEVNSRLNILHHDRVNIHEMSCPKRLYAPNNMGGKTYMDFRPDNSIEIDNAMVDTFCWQQTMNQRLPTRRLG